MEKPVADILKSLRKLTELHRQLLDVCRLEREALIEANLKAIQEATVRKQGLIEKIRAADAERAKVAAAIGDLPMSGLVESLQARKAKGADELRAAHEALKLLIAGIVEQNDASRALLERSLEHIDQMKRNVLGEAVPKSNTYNPQGQRQHASGGSRLISTEI